MFNDLLKEVNTAKKKEIAGKNVNVNANVNSNVTVKQTAKKEQDDIEDMLANLWSISCSTNTIHHHLRKMQFSTWHKECVPR